MDRFGVAYGTLATIGRNSSRPPALLPPAMSPPTLLGLRAAKSGGPVALRARAGSKRLGWAAMRNGARGAAPRYGARSAAAMSANVGPMCTVPARVHGSAVHGTGPDSA